MGRYWKSIYKRRNAAVSFLVLDRKLLILLALACIPACEHSSEPDPWDETTAEIIENLRFAGYVDEHIEVRDDGTVIAEGDILVTLPVSRELAARAENGDTFRQWSTNLRVGAWVRRLCVDGSRLGGVLSAGLDGAIANYNRLDLRFRMLRTGGWVDGCDTMVTMVVGDGTDAWAGFPWFGVPSWNYNIDIGSGVAGFGVPVATHVIMHELGHAIGFQHSDHFDVSISCGGQPGPGPLALLIGFEGVSHVPNTPMGATLNGSVMNACYNGGSTGSWTASDRVAMRELYARATEAIIWQHDSGQVNFWRMNSGTVTGFVDVSTPAPSAWHLVGSGDLDTDGTDDIVWQHDNGQVNFWRMQAGAPIDYIDVATPVGSDWHLRAIGDVDGDGVDDIVWQHDTGQVNFWRMQGGVPIAFVDVGTPVGPAWHLRGIGDFDGAGGDDILWQHDNGQVNYWRMQGGAPIDYINVSTPVSSDWHLKAVGDITHDGTDDIVWQHDSGQVNFWRMQAGAPIDYINVSTPVSSDWHLVAVGGIEG